MRRLVPLLLASLLVAGCFGAATDAGLAPAGTLEGEEAPRRAQPLPPAVAPTTQPGGAPAPAEAAAAVRERFPVELKADGMVVTVPVPVVLFGFPQATADALAEALTPRKVAHAAYNNPSILSSAPAFTTKLPIVANADYRVLVADEATYAAAVAVAGARDANAMEDWLALRLGADPTAPALVLLALPDAKGWTYAYPGGELKGVRVFGERQPLLVVDVTAPVDPWVGDRNAYDKPLDLSDAGVVGTLGELVAHATHHRLLQGPLYPPSTKPCHAVTILALDRATSLHTAGLLKRGLETFEPETLRVAFERLMGAPVHLDVKALTLPVDDPFLAALTVRGSSDALRAYLEMNFEKYHVAHEGCEPYLSVLVDGDATDGTHGIAQFDANEGRRIAFSFVDDVMQLCFERQVPVSCFDPTPGRFDWFAFLVAHETGHLLGQRHPHDITGGDVNRTRSFSSVWTPMSYQVGDSLWEFGEIDRNNQARNRVAYLYREAAASLDDATRAALVDALSTHGWQAAEQALRGAS